MAGGSNACANHGKSSASPNSTTAQASRNRQLRIWLRRSPPAPPTNSLPGGPLVPASAKRSPLVPEKSDFLEGDEPAADKVAAFLEGALASVGQGGAPKALVPWMCDALLSEHSLKAYGRDLVDFVRHVEALGITPLEATADHVKLYKRALVEAKMKPTTVARRLSVLRGAYQQFAAKGLVRWEVAQDIAAIQSPPVQKNSTPSLTARQAIALLEAVPQDTLQGVRDFALLSVFFITGCRVAAVVGACVGHLESDGVEHYLHVTEKRGKKAAKDFAGRRAGGARLRRAGWNPRGRGGAALSAAFPRRLVPGAPPPGPQDPVAAGEEVLPGGGDRPGAAGRPGHRHPLAPQDRHQRRH
jgi:hypothetical protein